MKIRICFFAFILGIVACGKQGGKADVPISQQEDRRAKEMLQGIWLSEDDGGVVFRVSGDTIYYPDSTSLPVAFQIVDDTLVLHGASDVHCAILRQAEHLFEFKNPNGDIVKVSKSDDDTDILAFDNSQPKVINQNRLIKRDTVLMVNGVRYHCYVQVNPTTYKVIKTTYNDEGLPVGNIYYDNIINLAVFQGTRRVFSSDFHKNDFSRQLSAEILKQSILSDMKFSRFDKDGIHYDAEVCIPDSPSSYVIDVLVEYSGKVVFNP